MSPPMAAAKKVAAQVQRLRTQAHDLVKDEKHEDGARVYQKLIGIDPSEPEWSRRAADCYLKLKDVKKRLKYSVLAAKAYTESGHLLKAIAMCKIALSIEPEHKETLDQLERLQARRPARNANAHGAGVRQIPKAAPLKTGPGRATRSNRKTSPRRRSLVPLAQAKSKHRAQKARARMAAAAALRDIRARRTEVTPGATEQSTAETSSAETTTPDIQSPLPLTPPTAEPGVAHQPDFPHESKPPSEPQPPSLNLPNNPIVPSLIIPEISTLPLGPGISIQPASNFPSIPAPGGRVSRPPLQSIILKEHVPTETRPSLPPQGKSQSKPGNIYSFTLKDVPAEEIRASGLPDVAPPHAPSIPSPGPAVIDPPSNAPERHPVEPVINEEDSLSFVGTSFENIPLLCELDPIVLHELISEVELIELETHEALFQEGDTADAMYVVVEGSVVAMTSHGGTAPLELARLEEGDFFGEIGLLSDQPRQAGVSALEPTHLLRFDRETVGALVDKDPEFLSILLQFLRDRLVEDLMLTSPLFAPFSDDERLGLAELFEFLEVEPNSLLLDRGQQPIGMYVLLTGEAICSTDEKLPPRRIGPGDVFGERALLHNEPAEIQVRTETKCYAICLPSDCFMEVIMTHPTVLEYVSSLSDATKGIPIDNPIDFFEHVTFF